MFKNVASQKIAVFAFDITTGAPKTGDAANITVYVNKDWAGVNALTDTSATEIDATNAKGWYLFDVSQAESNADAAHFTGKSTTANISVVGQLIYTLPPSFTSSVAQTGDAYAIVNSGTFGNAALKTLIDTIDDFVDTEVAAIKAKTDNLPSDPADASDIAASFATVNTKLDTIDDFIDTEVAAIKAKTDNLPAAPAAVGDVPTAAQNADKLLGRNLAGGSDGGRTVQMSLYPLRNKWGFPGGVYTVYEIDDTTVSWTATPTTDASADPITGNDPA